MHPVATLRYRFPVGRARSAFHYDKRVTMLEFSLLLRISVGTAALRTDFISWKCSLSAVYPKQLLSLYKVLAIKCLVSQWNAVATSIHCVLNPQAL